MSIVARGGKTGSGTKRYLCSGDSLSLPAVPLVPGRRDGGSGFREGGWTGSRRTASCLGFVSDVALALLVAPAPCYAQTDGMDKRGEARGTRQTGREGARDAKQDCKEDDSRAECRQQKRDTKQDTRHQAHDAKTTS